MPLSDNNKVVSQNFLIWSTNEREKLRVVVSKKVAPKAVDRNRIKRIIKEAIKNLEPYKGSIVIIVKNNVENLKTQTVQAELEEFWKIHGNKTS